MSSRQRDVILSRKVEIKSLETCSAEPEVFDNRLITVAVNDAYDPAAPQIMKLLAAVRIHAFGNHAHLPVGVLRVVNRAKSLLLHRLAASSGAPDGYAQSRM